MRNIVALILLVTLALAGCTSPAAQATAPVPTATAAAEAVAPTATPAPTDAPDEAAVEAATPTLAPIELPTEATRTIAEQRAAALESIDIAFDALALPDVPAAATVNGVEIPMSRFEDYLRLRLYSLTMQYDIDWSDAENQAYLPDIAQEVLDVRIQSQLMAAEALEKGVTPTDEEIAQYRDELLEQLETAEELDSQEDLLAAYGVGIETINEVVTDTLTAQALYNLQEPPSDEEQVKASHILVATAEEADAVLERLAAGEDFATLAQELSLDTASGAEGGELGWFPRGAMVAAFEEAAFALEPGELSSVVESDYGFHVILVEDKAERPLDETYAQLRQEDLFDQHLLDLQEAATIERSILTN